MRRSERSGKSRPTGFTLIELLVVVAIIATLIAILLPSLNAARRAARTTLCAANMRQVGTGWHMYADSSNGVVVPGRPARYADATRNVYWVGNGFQFRPRWYVTMGAEAGFFAFGEPSRNPADDNTKLIDGSRVFHCPEVPERVNNRNAPYGYNFQFLGNARFKGNSEANGLIRFPVKIDQIQGQTVMAADSLGTAAGKPRDARTEYRVDGSSDLFAPGNHAWSLDPPRLTATGDFCDDNNRAPEHRSAPELRHGGKANILWCDGHVAVSDYRALGYVENADGSIAASAANATNRLFSGTGRDDDPPSIE